MQTENVLSKHGRILKFWKILQETALMSPWSVKLQTLCQELY